MIVLLQPLKAICFENGSLFPVPSSSLSMYQISSKLVQCLRRESVTDRQNYFLIY